MQHYIKIEKKIYILFFIFVFFGSCSLNPFKTNEKSTNSESETKKKRAVYNVREKIDSQESGIIFGGKEKDNLGKQNIMWQATLKTLNFIPISSSDYQGGIIITDWYSDGKSNESIKITVKFNSNEVKNTSIDVKAFKKKCDNSNECKTMPMGQSFNRKIKDQIFNEIRAINTKTN